MILTSLIFLESIFNVVCLKISYINVVINCLVLLVFQRKEMRTHE